MREIQDLTLQRDRGLAAMDAELRRRADAFDGRLVELGRQGHSAVGIRVTLVPVGSSLFVPRVYGNADVSPVEEEFRARFGAWEGELHSPARTNRVRPIIRGARHVARETTHELLIDVMCDGTIDFTYLNTQPPPQDNVFSEWLFGITLNGLLSAIRLRSAAGAPATEYAVEVELRSVNKALAFRPFYSTSTADPSAGANHVRFPRLSLGSTDEWKRVLNILLRDAYNAAGRDPAGGW